MALSDLLWACPECGEDRGLSPDRPGYRCRACGTHYRREEGASIRARRPDGSEVVRRPAEWLAQLPDPQTIVAQHDGEDSTLRSARVRAARVTDFDTVHGEDGYLNRIEIWGEESPGTVEIRRDRLVYTPDGGARGNGFDWPLEAVNAVQASSSTLQINRRGEPPVSFRFLDDSIFLWEELLHAVLRDFYGRTGRGEIMEFQPRIVTA